MMPSLSSGGKKTNSDEYKMWQLQIQFFSEWLWIAMVLQIKFNVAIQAMYLHTEMSALVFM